MEFIFSTGKLSTEYLLTKSPTFTSIHYYLVKHPTIQSFEWLPNKTFASSYTFLSLTVTLYLTLTLLLSSSITPRAKSSFSAFVIRHVTTLHNAVLLTLSAVMAVGCTLSIFTILPSVDYLVCFEEGTPPRGPLFFWAYVFYLSKIYEFVDTGLILLSRSKGRRLSFLHVYHHATVVVMCYISLNTSQSMYPGILVTNSVVHVVMYWYYLLCSIGRRPAWKKVVTDCQIVQFWSSFGILGWVFYEHFAGSGCSGILGWCFDAVFIASLLFLFMDFHAKTYSKEGDVKEVNGNDNGNGNGVCDFVKATKQA